ncbi:MAG TPA: polyphosphate kinase 1 [Actinomycetota bacterium]|nr:polyphosphate kinase 1 [Actinomycetota bacterium]
MDAQPFPEPVTATTSRFINREVSWLEFDSRVLALAEDPVRPLLERVKFVAIFTQNLDEFFQIRVSGLEEQIDAGVAAMAPDGMSPQEQVVAIRERVVALQERADALVQGELLPALEKERIRIVHWDQLADDDKEFLGRRFRERIFPVLTPLSVDPSHPFPYISSLSLNLAAAIRDPVTGERRFARVKIPPLLPRFTDLPDGERFVPLEEVVSAHLDQLFPGMDIVEVHVFRVTRDADVEVEEDEADDLLAAIETVLQRRQRGATAIRLEIDPTMSDELRQLLMRELGVEESQVYVGGWLLALGDLWFFTSLDRPELKDEPWTPVTPPPLESPEGSVDVFEAIRAGDILVHHPYESFSASVEAFVEQAASDPDVLAIKQTLYRTSSESPIIYSLVRAAESGKQVVALVELKARFDELANITFARTLETAGVHVVYGVVGLKTHAKTSLVVRREGGGIRRYAHVGTGNYNPTTARLYEDLGLLTADPDLGADLTDLFNVLTGYSRQREYRKLLVAPVTMRPGLEALIRREMANDDGSVVLKMNALVDPDLIDTLYEASQAGVRIDLLVRGICCLRPRVPGLSETIHVRSLVGRFLEHSRIYRFGSEERGFDHLIGSADLMPRNLDRRVEALAPVQDPSLRERLNEILRVELDDDELAWELDGDGSWHKVSPTRGIDAHRALQDLAVARSGGGR